MSSVPGDGAPGRRRTALRRALAAVALLALAACGGSPAPAAAPSGPPVSELRVGLQEYRLQLSAGQLRAGTVTVTATNAGSSSHDVVFVQGGRQVGGSRLLSPGGRESLQVQLAAGTVELRCTVTGHAQAGMRTVMTVAG